MFLNKFPLQPMIFILRLNIVKILHDIKYCKEIIKELSVLFTTVCLVHKAVSGRS